MVFIETPYGGSSFRVDASKVTTAVMHTATGNLVVSFKNDSGAIRTAVVSGRDAADLYAAFTALASVSLSSTT